MRRIVRNQSFVFFVAVFLTAWSGCAHAQLKEARTANTQSQEKPGQSTDKRQGLPADLRCPADYQVTLWEGKVIAFERSDRQTEISIHSDWDADYSAVIRHESGGARLDLFRYKGEAFKQDGWMLIESEPNKLKPNMRARVWVCTDKEGKDPLVQRIDWLGVEAKRGKATP